MKTEKIFWALFIVAFILRLLNIPRYGVLTVLTLSLLSLIYFPAGFYFFCDKNIKQQNIALSIISGIFLSIIPLGILFKLQHYPGGGFITIIGSVAGISFIVITYFIQNKSSEKLHTYYKNMSLRTLVLTIAIIFFTLLPGKFIIQIQYHNDPELVKFKTQVLENPGNRQYQEDLNKYLFKKDSIAFIKKIRH
jgi:hypothetical protein